jgi:tetratricopeptide (TPR) repeat protein
MDIVKDCEDALDIALPEARRGNEAMAETLKDVLRSLDKHETPVALELSALALFGLARLDAARSRHQKAHKRREQAIVLLDRAKAPGDSLSVLDMIADELMDLGENRRALVFCNRAVALSRGPPGRLGVRLWRAARCHRRVGFNDAAVILLGNAIPLLRGDPKLPFLPYALLELGTATVKSAPAEAAEALREATGLFEAKGDLVNAGTAWLNLGVALSHRGELDSALAAYESARALRDRNPATTVAQRGNLHNNIAGLYRRKRDFARARAEAGEAIAGLKTVGGEFYAHALGTLGEISRDEGKLEEALAHFAAARALYERLPGANLEKLASKLENEGEALKALGRAREARALKKRVSELRREAAPPAPAIPIARDEAKSEAFVVVALDGQTLPDEVYATCDLGELERRLERRLAETGAGELDGHMTGPETTEVYLAGADAHVLFEAVEPILRAYPLCMGAAVELRQGEQVTRVSLRRRPN